MELGYWPCPAVGEWGWKQRSRTSSPQCLRGEKDVDDPKQPFVVCLTPSHVLVQPFEMILCGSILRISSSKRLQREGDLTLSLQAEYADISMCMKQTSHKVLHSRRICIPEMQRITAVSLANVQCKYNPYHLRDSEALTVCTWAWPQCFLLILRTIGT